PFVLFSSFAQLTLRQGHEDKLIISFSCFSLLITRSIHHRTTRSPDQYSSLIFPLWSHTGNNQIAAGFPEQPVLNIINSAFCMNNFLSLTDYSGNGFQLFSLFYCIQKVHVQVKRS